MNSVLTSVQFTGAGENGEYRRAYMYGTWLVLGTHGLKSNTSSKL